MAATAAGGSGASGSKAQALKASGFDAAVWRCCCGAAPSGQATTAAAIGHKRCQHAREVAEVGWRHWVDQSPLVHVVSYLHPQSSRSMYSA